MVSWHTKKERKMIIAFGGTPETKFGYDGKIRGKPVEVRSVKKDDRFRIQRDTHRELVRQGGSYIFTAPGQKAKKVSARKVSGMVGNGKWFKDRVYPHKFLKKDAVF